MTIPWSESLYRVVIGGTDVSSRIAPHLIKVEVEDKAGTTSDTASIELDDGPNGRFVLPLKGDPVEVWLGSKGRGLVQRFTGSVDTVRWRLDRGGGRRLEIHAKGMDTSSKVKEPTQKHWDDKKLGDVMKEAGKSAGIKSVEVHKDLASISRDYWAMDGESFVAFGHRVAREVGGTFKIVGDRAVIVPRSAGVSASGKALTTIVVSPGDNLISAEIAPDSGRPRYKKVKGRHYDKAKAKWIETDVEVDTGGDETVTATQTLPFARPTKDDAERAARAEGKDSEREKGGGPVEIDGNPLAVAEATCILTGCRPGVDGSFKIESVRDTLDRQGGYRTRLDLVAPDAKVGADKRSKRNRK